jgi:hypothetical protein
MKLELSVIELAVADMAATLAFYRRSAWTSQPTPISSRT